MGNCHTFANISDHPFPNKASIYTPNTDAYDKSFEASFLFTVGATIGPANNLAKCSAVRKADDNSLFDAI